MIRVEDYVELIADCTYDGTRVAPVGNLAHTHPRLRHPLSEGEKRRLGH